MRSSQSLRSRQFLVISVHNEEIENRSHIHVVHARPWSNRSCRCRMLDERIRTQYRQTSGRDITKAYTINLMRYLPTFPRFIYYIYLPGSRREVLRPNKNFPVCRCDNWTTGEIMDENDSGIEVCSDRYARRSSDRISHISNSASLTASQSTSRGANSRKEEEIYELVKELSITPINNSV